MALYPAATRKLLPENSSATHITPTQVILHTAVDSPGPTSLFPYFSRLDVSVETHFFVKFDGQVEQYMDTNSRADANNRANVRAISIETEDDGNPEGLPWTASQLAAMKSLMRWAWAAHPAIAKRVCRAWDDPGVGYHSMWGAPSNWTVVKGKTCPGSTRIRQFKNTLAPWIESQNRSAAKPPRRNTEQMLVRNQENGAVLHVLGSVTVLVDNAADFADYVAAGIPVVNVQPSQFSRYEKLRVA